MFCKQTQNITNTLLRFKIDDKTTTINLIGSFEDSINIPAGIKNKIASSAVIPKTRKREVAELPSLLNLHYR